MARNARQNKIIEAVNSGDIETQEELVAILKAANFIVTQATISRDIKELGLIKVLDDKTKRYKYSFATVQADQTNVNKFVNIFKEAVVSVCEAGNLAVIKTIKGMATAVSNIVDHFNIEGVLGCVSGDDSVMVIAGNNISAHDLSAKLNSILVN